MFKLSDFKLCYVRNDILWFTTKEVSEQWGDDWDDKPYQHNAGDPYHAFKTAGVLKERHTPNKYTRILREYHIDGTAWLEITEYDLKSNPAYELLKIGYYGYYETPADSQREVSVDDINSRNLPWLWDDKNKCGVYPGASVKDVIKFLQKQDNPILIPLNKVQEFADFDIKQSRV